MKKKFITGLTIGAMVLSLAACGSESKTSSQTTEKESVVEEAVSGAEEKNEAEETSAGTNEDITVRIANMGNSYILTTALNEGFFAEYLGENVTVELINVQSAADQAEAFAAGGLDIGAGGDVAFVTSIGNGNKLTIIGIGNSSDPSDFALMVPADSDITSIEQLEGKTVGVAFGTGLHHLLGIQLGSVGLTYDDVEVINLNPADAYTALVAGTVDAAITSGTNIDMAESQGAKIVSTAEGFLDMLSVAVVDTEFAEQHPDLVRGVFDAEYAAYKWAHESEENKITALTYVEDLTGVPVETLALNFDASTFDYTITDELIAGLQSTADYLYEQELATQDPDVSQFVDASYLEGAEYLNLK